jgi:Arc/MetJ family transcription regulator
VGKRAINMRLEEGLLNEAKKALGTKGTTETVEVALRNSINNRKIIEFLKKNAGKSDWKGFDDKGNLIL